jgi:putative membrane protein
MTWDLLAGTLVLRPYVFAFLAAFLAIAFKDLGARRTLGFLGTGFVLAFGAEYASTRVGIPFGLYHYTGATAGRELFLSNVPFFDPLCFPFLAYASWCVARHVLRRSRGPAVIGLAAFSMMMLDVVIDPLAVRGERWFLGNLFYYPEGGLYFGVPLSNFVGWFVVGFAIVGAFLTMSPAEPKAAPAAGIGLYYGVLAFNLGITLWIGEPVLAATGLALHAFLAVLVWRSQALPFVLVPERVHKASGSLT